MSNNNDSNSGSQEYPIIWYCFSHRCMTSPLVKRMIQKQVLSPSQSSQWYDFDIVTRMKASMIIQRAWRSYLVNVSSVVLSLSSIKVVDNCLMEAMANCLLRSHKQQLTLATQSVGLSTSTPEDLCDSCPHMPIQEKPSSISPRVRDFKKRVRYFKKLESPSLQAVQPSFLLYHSSKRNPYAAFIEPQPILCR